MAIDINGISKRAKVAQNASQAAQNESWGRTADAATDGRGVTGGGGATVQPQPAGTVGTSISPQATSSLSGLSRGPLEKNAPSTEVVSAPEVKRPDVGKGTIGQYEQGVGSSEEADARGGDTRNSETFSESQNGGQSAPAGKNETSVQSASDAVQQASVAKPKLKGFRGSANFKERKEDVPLKGGQVEEENNKLNINNKAISAEKGKENKEINKEKEKAKESFGGDDGPQVFNGFPKEGSASSISADNGGAQPSPKGGLDGGSGSALKDFLKSKGVDTSEPAAAKESDAAATTPSTIPQAGKNPDTQSGVAAAAKGSEDTKTDLQKSDEALVSGKADKPEDAADKGAEAESGKRVELTDYASALKDYDERIAKMENTPPTLKNISILADAVRAKQKAEGTTPEELEAAAKRRAASNRVKSLIAAITDILSGAANLFFTSKGAPSTTLSSLSKMAAERADKDKDSDNKKLAKSLKELSDAQAEDRKTAMKLYIQELQSHNMDLRALRQQRSMTARQAQRAKDTKDNTDNKAQNAERLQRQKHKDRIAEQNNKTSGQIRVAHVRGAENRTTARTRADLSDRNNSRSQQRSKNSKPTPRKQ